MGEAELREWANGKAAGAGCAVQIASFKDGSLRDGVFILHVLLGVAPECVDAALILPGGTAEERHENAKYAVSCAHKAGCTTFMAAADIEEVQPRMILCLLAAAMSLDLKRDQISLV